MIFHPERMGGAFGRNEAADFVLEAVELARRMPDVPVQLVWSRDDDLRNGLFHPPSRHRLAARLEGGRIAVWRHRVASPSAERQWGSFGRHPQRIAKAESSGAWNLPHVADEMLVECADPPCPIPLGFWRGIEIGSNVFAVESFVDELAHAARHDPFDFRLAHLGESVVSTVVERPFALARLRTCFELAAERKFTTIDGLDPKALHPVQRAWLETDVSPCGYCQGGMILEAVALLARTPQPTEEEIDAGLYGVLCRCGTYDRVRRAVRRAAEIANEERSGT